MNGTEAGWTPAGERNGPRVVMASVFIRGREVPYLRAGHGRWILALSADPRIRGALGAAFCSAFRVIAPLDGQDPDHSPVVRSGAWIADFLDGLGVGAAAVVAGPEWAAAAFELEREAADRVDRILHLEAAHPEAIGRIRAALEED